MINSDSCRRPPSWQDFPFFFRTVIFALALFSWTPFSMASDIEGAKSAFFKGDIDISKKKFFDISISDSSPHIRAEADYYLALIFIRKGSDEESQRLHFKHLEQSAKAGFSTAMWELGKAYEDGIGVPPDFYQAMDWFRRAKTASVGEVKHISFFDASDEAWTPQSPAERIKAIKEVADSGDLEAQYQLARAFDISALSPNDPDRALYWYRKAAQGGHSRAQYTLSYFYCRGVYMDKDSIAADFWLERSGRTGKCETRQGAEE